jgi:hypothetical protein
MHALPLLLLPHSCPASTDTRQVENEISLRSFNKDALELAGFVVRGGGMTAPGGEAMKNRKRYLRLLANVGGLVLLFIYSTPQRAFSVDKITIGYSAIAGLFGYMYVSVDGG